jgi:hypothetical protein
MRIRGGSFSSILRKGTANTEWAYYAKQRANKPTPPKANNAPS